MLPPQGEVGLADPQALHNALTQIATLQGVALLTLMLAERLIV